MDSMKRAGFRVESQKMEVLGRLTSSVIHDLNNLLTVIGLNAGLIETGDLGKDEMITSAQKILDASRHSADLTRKILNFARRHSEEPEAIHPGEMIDGMLRMLSPLIARKISVRVEPKCESWIHGNRNDIELAVMNLVLNAVDAMPNGGEIVISTELRRDDESGRALVAISVSDEGEGISPEISGAIFDPFFTTKGAGTGMGLSIVDHVAKKNHGRVEFESRPGAGSEFRILFPESTPLADEEEAGASSQPPTGRRRGTVLLVEDDNAIRQLTSRLLATQFKRVLDAPTAEDALEIWNDEAGTIDLLLTDLVLPGAKSGRDLALELRETDPDLPVLYMSGFGSSWKDRSFLTEFNFLPKPFPRDALERAIEKVLDGGKN